VAKITIYNRAYSTHNIVGVYITASDYKSWGYNYIDFKIEPDYHLSKPIEIGSCSEKNDIRIVYDNDRKFEYYNIDIECGKDYTLTINDRGVRVAL